MAKVTVDSTWDNIPRITERVFMGALARLGSPIYPTGRAAYNLAGWYPTLMLGLAVRETRAGTKSDDELFLEVKNALAIRVFGAPMVFDDWACAFAALRNRLIDPDYKGGVYQQASTIHQFVEVYTGLTGDAALAYAKALVTDINYWLSI